MTKRRWRFERRQHTAARKADNYGYVSAAAGVTPAELARWRAAARRDGKTLSRWIRDIVNAHLSR